MMLQSAGLCKYPKGLCDDNNCCETRFEATDHHAEVDAPGGADNSSL